MGQESSPVEYASIDEGFSFKKPLTYYPTVELYHESGNLKARFKPGQGSGDLSNLMDNNAFAEMDAEVDKLEKGEQLPVIRFR